MTTPWLILMLCLAAGGMLGGLYFGGLLLTFHTLNRHRNALLLLPLSFCVRIVIFAAGAFFIAAHDWQRWLAVLAGFLLIRLVFLTASKILPHGPEAPAWN